MVAWKIFFYKFIHSARRGFSVNKELESDASTLRWQPFWFKYFDLDHDKSVGYGIVYEKNEDNFRVGAT